MEIKRVLIIKLPKKTNSKVWSYYKAREYFLHKHNDRFFWISCFKLPFNYRGYNTNKNGLSYESRKIAAKKSKYKILYIGKRRFKQLKFRNDIGGLTLPFREGDLGK